MRDLAPERTYYIASLSKVLNHGLRLAYVLPPSQATELLRQAVLSDAGYAPPAFGSYILARWLEDGTANSLIQQNIQISRQRVMQAKELLGSAMATPGGPTSLHVWLPMPTGIARRIGHAALRAGVEVTPVDAPMAAALSDSGLRLCLGALSDPDEFQTALRLFSGALHNPAEAAPML